MLVPQHANLNKLLQIMREWKVDALAHQICLETFLCCLLCVKTGHI